MPGKLDNTSSFFIENPFNDGYFCLMSIDKSYFIRACWIKKVDEIPIWFMRQAGRYLPEYRKIRKKFSFLNMCKNPEISAEITLQPLKRFKLDAGIIFADILLPFEGMGLKIEFSEKGGPHILNPVRCEKDLMRLRILDPKNDTPYLLSAIKIVKNELGDKLPLIGFSGAPFTLASYAIEGKGSKDYVSTKTLMFSEKKLWEDIMNLFTSSIINYLKAQIDAGVDCIQLFDSWAGTLSPEDYKNYVLPYTKRIFSSLKETGVPGIHFSTGTTSYLKLIKEVGSDVIGIDWRIDIRDAFKEVGGEKAIQGNLDPAVLLGPGDVVVKSAKKILKNMKGKNGFIFNLGHGILPSTPIRNIELLIDTVKSY